MTENTVILIGFDYQNEVLAKSRYRTQGVRVVGSFPSFENVLGHLAGFGFPTAIAIANYKPMCSVDIQRHCEKIAGKIVDSTGEFPPTHILMRQEPQLVRIAAVFTDRAIRVTFFQDEYA